MAVPLEAFLAATYLAGSFEGSVAELRSLLDAGSVVELSDVTVVAIADLAAGAAERSPVGSLAAGEVLLAALPLDPDAPLIHKVNYPVELALGPYTVAGMISMFPGFDPTRALTRPQSDFMDMHDAEVAIQTAGDDLVQPYDTLVVNRFAVERIRAEIDMTFWFPGAEQEPIAEE
jgi:hypothetical protein